MAPAMPCKTSKTCKHEVTRGKYKRSNQNLRVSWKPVNPQEWASLPKYHEDHIAGKGDNSLQHYNLVLKFILLPPWRYPQQKQQWINNGRNLKNVPVWGHDKSQKQIRGDRWSKDEGHKKFIFASLMDICHLRNAELGDESTKKYEGRVVLRGDIVKDDSGSFCSIHRTRIISITNDGSKTSWISYPDCQGAQYKQLMQYLIIPRSKWRMLQNYWKFPNRNVQTCGYVYQKRTWPKSMSSMEDPVVPLERNLYGHPF